TQAIQSKLDALTDGEELARFPATLAFQSAADATVTAPALVTGLFDRLAGGEHELVVFDINRFTDIEPILARDPDAWLREILSDAGNSFTISVVTNESEQEREVVLRRRGPDTAEISETRLGLRWPRGLYSLSHVSLPFPADDPLYGDADGGGSPGIQLGTLALRGERGVLLVGAQEMLRLRWNPFYSYIRERTLELADERAPARR
ncbi:MAG: alpha/beta hydrolase, partial [Deltaproteobacteria bacterium]|nr:alpha/beta hydrolase [Deltaproteobacteria bacterium]